VLQQSGNYRQRTMIPKKKVASYLFFLFLFFFLNSSHAAFGKIFFLRKDLTAQLRKQVRFYPGKIIVLNDSWPIQAGYIPKGGTPFNQPRSKNRKTENTLYGADERRSILIKQFLKIHDLPGILDCYPSGINNNHHTINQTKFLDRLHINEGRPRLVFKNLKNKGEESIGNKARTIRF